MYTLKILGMVVGHRREEENDGMTTRQDKTDGGHPREDETDGRTP